MEVQQAGAKIHSDTLLTTPELQGSCSELGVNVGRVAGSPVGPSILIRAYIVRDWRYA